MLKRFKASSAQVSRNMKKVRTCDTDPEMAVMKLYSLSLRYRVNYRPREPGIGRSTIDNAFPGHPLAIFIDGCFWHCCPEHGEIPKANRDWWLTKFAENKSRDARITNLLVAGEWKSFASGSMSPRHK